MMRRIALAAALTAVLMMVGSAAASAYPAPPPDQPAQAPNLMPVHTLASHPKQVHALRRATRAFHNLQRAENAGYGLLTDAAGVACIAMPGMGGMGVHFADAKLVGNPSEQIRHPEALVYRLDKNNRLRLAAVEYVVIASAWNATHTNPPRLFGHRFALTAAPNRFGLPTFYSLHAWVWDHNPAGRFAPFNPRVSCPS